MTVQESTICKLIQTFPVLLILAQKHNKCLKTPLIYKPPTPTHSPEYYEALDALFHNLYGHGYHGNHNHPTCYHGYGSYGHGHDVMTGHGNHASPCHYDYGYPHGHGYNPSHNYGSGGYGYHTYPIYVYKRTLNSTRVGNKGSYAPNQAYNFSNKYRIVIKRNKHRPQKKRAEKITEGFFANNREDRHYGSFGFDFKNTVPSSDKIHMTLTGLLSFDSNKPKTTENTNPFFYRPSITSDNSNQYGSPYFNNDYYQNKLYRPQNGQNQNYNHNNYQTYPNAYNTQSNPYNNENNYHNYQNGQYYRPQNYEKFQTNYNYQNNQNYRPSDNEHPVNLPQIPSYKPSEQIIVIEYEDNESDTMAHEGMRPGEIKHETKPVVFPETNPNVNSNHYDNNNTSTNLSPLTTAPIPNDYTHDINANLPPLKPVPQPIFKPISLNNNNVNMDGKLPPLTSVSVVTDGPIFNKPSDIQNNDNNNNNFSPLGNVGINLPPLIPITGTNDDEILFRPPYQNSNANENTYLPNSQPVPGNNNGYEITLSPLEPIPETNEYSVLKPVKPESVFKPPQDTKPFPINDDEKNKSKEIPLDLIIEEEKNVQFPNIDPSTDKPSVPTESENYGSGSNLPPLKPVNQESTLPPLQPVPANPSDSRSNLNIFKETCLTVEGGQGRCVLIFDCDYYVQLAKESRTNPGIVQLLRRAHCGFEGNNPKVCCPLSEIPTIAPTTPSTTTTPATTTTTTRPTDTSMDSEDLIPAFYDPPVCGFSNASSSRVVGGVDANLGDFPWMAILGYNSIRFQTTRWLCGGSLVSEKHILTAAHCIHNKEGELYVVRLGELDLARDDEGATPIDILIKKMVKHENYDPNSFANDIGILVLQQSVTFTDLIRPICIPRTPELRSNNYENYRPLIAGWGDLEFRGAPATRLQVLQLPVVSNEFCVQAYAAYKTQMIDERVLCAGFKKGGKDACQGDSGGPLMQPIWDRTIFKTYFYQIGVVSYGRKCAEVGFPGVYTRVTHFLPWLEKTLIGVTSD